MNGRPAIGTQREGGGKKQRKGDRKKGTFVYMYMCVCVYVGSKRRTPSSVMGTVANHARVLKYI